MSAPRIHAGCLSPAMGVALLLTIAVIEMQPNYSAPAILWLAPALLILAVSRSGATRASRCWQGLRARRRLEDGGRSKGPSRWGVSHPRPGAVS